MPPIFVNLMREQIYEFMFRVKLFLFFTFSLLAFASIAQEKKQNSNPAKEGFVKATIIDYKVDGCGFLIQFADKQKTKLVPEKLSDDLKKDKLKVWVKYSLAKKQLMGTCNAGTQCEV